MSPAFLSFLAVTAVLVLTPGAGTAVVAGHALRGGRLAGLRAAVGVALGNATQASVAGVGLAALVVSHPVWLAGVRAAGAVYLGLLGARHVWEACGVILRRRSGGRPGMPRPVTSTRHAVWQGWLTNMLNPAVTTFYLVAVPSFLPAFTGPASAGRLWVVQPRFALYAGVHVGMAFACHCAWVVGLDRAGRAFGAGPVRTALSGTAGVALLLLSLRLLLPWGQ